ncbi:PIR Superfamily Protein [Plasmodium ovale curtisi]|uniref:PIR Superfamily Protein n=1 Tax=Plasmodium ovale curtisi TaxID=864141 RepID=A0A1A8WK94_PLAOA|nr:PIR Superfamily Protein [Plasmodium ovale curtisi]
MSINRKDFTLTKLAEKFDFFKGSYFYQFYQELDKLYENEEKSETCKTDLFSGVDDPDVIKFLIKISGILKRLLNKEISVKNAEKLEDKHCIYLNLNDIYDIKNLYDYSELLYNADVNVYDKISEDNKYLDYFKKGLDLYKRSKTRCPTDTKNAYCYEFNEYEKIHNKYKKKNYLFYHAEKRCCTHYTRKIQHNTPDVTLDYELHKLLDKLLNEVKLHSFYALLTKHNGNYASSSCIPINTYPIKEESAICNLFERVKKIFYFLWHKHVMDNKDIINKCNNENSYGFSIEELRNKKKLFDFLEYYNKIREKLKEDNNKKRKHYCDYIRSIFELYKDIIYNNALHEYSEELWLLRKTFFRNDELRFLKKKCPNMCLDLVFDVKYKTLCPLEKLSLFHETVDLNICENAELSAVNRYNAKDSEKEYIFEDLNTFGVYNELNREVFTDSYYGICSKLLNFSKEHCGIYGLCIKLARNVKDLSYKKNKERTDSCEYIIHWMFDRIQKILKIGTNNNYDANALNDFLKCDDTYNPHNLFKALKCKEYQKFYGGMQKIQKSHFADYHVIWLTEYSGKIKEKPLLRMERMEYASTPEMESSRTPENVCDIITCDPFYVAFTPLGSYFHNKKAKKKRPIFNKVKSNI